MNLPPIRRRHFIDPGERTVISAQRLSFAMWYWRVWRVRDGSMVMTGYARTKKRAMATAESWRRVEAYK